MKYNFTYPKHFVILLFCVISWGIATGQPKYSIEPLTLKTSDNVNVSANLYKPLAQKGKRPGLILIHQGGSSKEEWKPFLADLIGAEYVVLAYDVRGHGESDKVESLGQLFNDPELAPKDLDAAIDYLQKRKDVDSKRIGIIGASIGGNLSAMASSEKAIKSAVSISSKTSAVYNLSGKKELKMKSVFYISSDGDQGGKRADWAKELYDLTDEPRKISIVESSSKHGVNALKDSESIMDEILLWFEETL